MQLPNPSALPEEETKRKGRTVPCRAVRSRSIEAAVVDRSLVNGDKLIVMSTEEKKPSSSYFKRKSSCTICFNDLWFCYSPVHQMQQYYRLGVLDNCSTKYNALVDCLMLKTKRSSEVQEILEAREKSKSHIWNFRTTEEASYNWKETYGHLDNID